MTLTLASSSVRLSARPILHSIIVPKFLPERDYVTFVYLLSHRSAVCPPVVCNVLAPYTSTQPAEIFGNVSTPLCTLVIHQTAGRWWWRSGVLVSALASINEVNQRRARLIGLPRWMTGDRIHVQFPA